MPTITTFTVSIELGNDAMQTPDDVAFTLREVSHQLAGLQAWYDTTRPIRDLNGNTVGSWAVDAVTSDIA